MCEDVKKTRSYLVFDIVYPIHREDSIINWWHQSLLTPFDYSSDLFQSVHFSHALRFKELRNRWSLRCLFLCQCANSHVQEFVHILNNHGKSKSNWIPPPPPPPQHARMKGHDWCIVGICYCVSFYACDLRPYGTMGFLLIVHFEFCIHVVTIHVNFVAYCTFPFVSHTYACEDGLWTKTDF